MVTNSYDVTSDVVVSRLPPAGVFRFNVDQWAEYTVVFTHDGFSIRSPGGHTIREQDVSHLYWRKPFDPADVDPVRGTMAHWQAEQRWYVLVELCNVLRRAGVPALVEPHAERRLGKLVQMRLAAEAFRVPEWCVWQGEAPPMLDGDGWLVKSLVMEPLGENRFLYVTPVDSTTLAPEYLWFCQRTVEAASDITVVYIDGRCHAYRLDRATFPGVDWREHLTDLTWDKVAWSEDRARATQRFMAACGLRFGRLDFLETAEGDLFFLEVNPNGQFAWLDPDGTDGCIDDVIAALSGEKNPTP